MKVGIIGKVTYATQNEEFWQILVFQMILIASKMFRFIKLSKLPVMTHMFEEPNYFIYKRCIKFKGA
jgi:hypothetical protein